MAAANPASRALLEAADRLVSPERRIDRSPAVGPKAERTRRRLVESASELFAEQGFTGTTAADVAKRAGVSLGTFYAYFAELNDVLGVIVVDFIKASLERGIDRWDVGTGRKGLRTFVEAFVTTYVEFRDFMELYECAKLVEPRIREVSGEYLRFYRRGFERSFDDAARRELIRRDVRPDLLAEAVTVLLERLCYDRVLALPKGDTPDVDEMVDLLATLIADVVGLVSKDDPSHI